MLLVYIFIFVHRAHDQPGNVTIHRCRYIMLGIAQLINEASSYELNSDHEVALRLYKTAFNNLLDINGQVNSAVMNNVGQLSGVSPFEIRSVADYLSYKTCHIQFLLNHPREAITQFKKYIDTFKQHTRSPEYVFEHSAWLSQQYLMFADLFHQAVIGGTKASKTQHPGYYYYETAMQMLERRRNITEYTNDDIRSNQMPVTNELLSMITTSHFASFLRQCGWTCVDSDMGPPVGPVANSPKSDPERKVEPINYTETIIRVLYRAIEYFEEWGRPRMQIYISVMIADEYAANQDLQKAQTLYKRSLIMYEKECWTPLVDHIKEQLSIVAT